MFRKWLEENDVSKFDFSGTIFPKISDREFWDARYNEYSVKVAEEKIGCDWPVIKATDFMAFDKTGDRACMQKPFYERRFNLGNLVMGELFENKGRFLPDIVNGLFAICEETYWGLSAHRSAFVDIQNIPDPSDPTLDLGSTITAANLSIIYSVLYDKLNEFCPEILKRIEDEIERRIEIPFLNRRDFWWQHYRYGGANNWNPTCLSNILTPFLLVEKRRAYVIKGIEKILFEINHIYTSLPEDGGCDEGSSYWTGSGGELFEFCEKIYRATNGEINFFNDEKMKRILSYPCRTYIGNSYFVNYADGSCFLNYGTLPSGYLYLLGKRTGIDAFYTFAKERYDDKNLIEQREKPRDVWTLTPFMLDLTCINEVPSVEGKFKADDCILPNLQQSFVRNETFYYSSKGGHNSESHNHNDVGSVICFVDGTPVFIDSGNLVYTKKTFSSERYTIWNNQSDWHNLPIVNGASQLNGWQYQASSFNLENKKTTISFHKAYAPEAELKELVREINIEDDKFTVCDNFAFNKDNNEVCENFLTCREVEVKGSEVVIDGKYILKASCDCEISVEKKDITSDERMMFSWPNGFLNRISFKFKTEETVKICFELKKA